MNANTAERVTEEDGAAFEGEIREFIRKDIAPSRRIPTEAGEFAVNSVNSLVQRVAGTSLQEIDNLVIELQNLRDEQFVARVPASQAFPKEIGILAYFADVEHGRSKALNIPSTPPGRKLHGRQ